MRQGPRRKPCPAERSNDRRGGYGLERRQLLATACVRGERRARIPRDDFGVRLPHERRCDRHGHIGMGQTIAEPIQRIAAGAFVFQSCESTLDPLFASLRQALGYRLVMDCYGTFTTILPTCALLSR